MEKGLAFLTNFLFNSQNRIFLFSLIYKLANYFHPPALAHLAVRSLMFQASTTTDKSPLRFSFTGTLRILRRAISLFQQASLSSLPSFFSWLISEITQQIIPNRQGRTNPRVVKKPRSKFQTRKPIHRTGFTQLQPLTFCVVFSAA